ncbi:MAG: nucleoside/nucleotide kinase family protein [Clostridia bacterium]|nr:nucleoside/nucleotide kinase family protein [Clostridia bacterium]
MEYRTSINGIDVRAEYSQRAIDGIFLPLLKRIMDLQREKGKRVLVMLAAPPGAGKSTLLSFLEALCRERAELRAIQTIGMDGFHRRQEYLQSHFVTRDGKRVRMVEIKGAPITFDLQRLAAGVRAVASGAACGWPGYDRRLHNPVEDAITVDGDIVLLEGNYLLLDEDGWRELSACADYTVSVRADEDMLRRRLIDRRIKTGVEREAAIRFVDYSDMPNVRLCLEKTMPADARLTVDADGEYHADGIG